MRYRISIVTHNKSPLQSVAILTGVCELCGVSVQSVTASNDGHASVIVLGDNVERVCDLLSEYGGFLEPERGEP